MKRALKKLFAGLGYSVQGTRYTPRQLLDPSALRPLSFDDAVCRLMFDRGEALNFVQVGVFDGVTNDPLRKYIERCGWAGVLVEPQSCAVEKLQNLYRNNVHIQVVRAALDEYAGLRSLYTVVSEEVPSWAGGLASFNRDVILKHRKQIPNIEAMLVEESVPCMRFDDILAMLTAPLDLLQIDTEGADAYILSLFPFERVRPAIVQWEVKHLTTSQREECMTRLAVYGYRFSVSSEEDMLAVNF